MVLWVVDKWKRYAKSWLPVVIWFVVIYSASGDQNSVHHSSRLIEPLVRWLFPSISTDAVWRVVLVVRKCAHVTEYAILAMLLWRGLNGSFRLGLSEWSWRLALLAWGGAVLFAISDEWHQVFVPGRQGSPWDVAIDSFGAAMGLFFLRRARRFLARRKTAVINQS